MPQCFGFFWKGIDCLGDTLTDPVGWLAGHCDTRQKGRGGLFCVLEEPKLHDSIAQLISGASAPVMAP
jgi:hypothetical protein